MERHMRLSRAAVVLVAIALIAAIAAAVWFASPESPYVPSEDSGAALGAAAPAEDGTVANQQTTVPSGYTGIYTTTDFGSVRSGGRGTNGSSAKYILMEDITVTSIDTTAWTGDDGNPWKGELNGNGHTITLSGTAEGEYYDNGGLFSVIGGGANVHDLTIVVQNVRVDNNEGSANFGVIAGNACGAVTVDNVYIRLDKDSSNNGDAYVSSNGTTWLGGVFGKVEGSDVSISNTTVYNAAAGNRGFSGTMVKDSGVYVGGFVGSIDKGDLTVSNIAYKADDDAKIFAVAESGASWNKSNTTLTGGVLGYHNEGSFTLDGLIFDAQVSLDSNNNPNFGTQNGDSPHAAYIVGQVDGGLSDVWSDIYINADNGTTWLDGNNETRGTAVRYDKSVFADIRFADGEKVAVAVGKQSPANAGLIPRTITQGADTSKISDAEIAGAITEGSGTAWLTINKVNATTNVKMSVGDSVSTGNYNLTSPTISSVDGTTYKGSKEYDGTAYATPYITIGSKQINAWTADNTTADAGVKNFAYAGDSALTGYQVVSYANGDKYLVKDGTVYSPSTITIGGQSGQAFKLGNSFSYEITPASVTVTPKVPDDDLYTGNSMPEITATAVDGGGSPVEGTIAWDEPNATLISGTHSYNWTWTPNSSNYQTVKDSMELEAFDRKIERLTVQDDYKKEYTAFEPFDSTSVKVIAYYTDGSSEQLVNDECKFEVENGDINKLVVTDVTVTVSLKKGSDVSTKISIFVSKLAVDVPTAVEDLVYNGQEQIGVEASAYGYYLLSGNTAETNAGDYVATATLTDTKNTRWDTDTEDDTTPKEIGWSIAKMVVSGEIVAPESLVYDGSQKAVSFDGQLSGNDEFGIAYEGDRQNVTADGFTVTVSLPNDNNYEWADGVVTTAAYKIEPKDVEIESIQELSKTYDGNVVDPKSLFTAPNGVNDEGALQLAFVITVDGENRDEILNAGTYTVTAVLADGQTNYTAQSAQARYEIAKVVLTGTLTFDCTATYDGTAKTATFTLTSDNLVGQDSVGEVTYNNVDRINVTGQAIVASVALPSSGNYQWQDGVEPTASLTIVKATPAVTVKLSDDMPGNLTVAATLDNDWLVRTDNTGVEGTLAWDKAGELLQQGEVKYGWTFVPTDSNNYNNETGFLSITASEDTLQSITVKDGTYKTEYTAYEDFDPTGLVVIAQYASGTKVEVTSGFTLKNDKELTDGQITVTLNGESTTITVTVNKREIPLPAATEGLIFNGQEQNGIDQKWIEQYAEFVKVEGNLQTNAGDYQATVTLTKDTTYVTWKGGDTGAQTIDWSIAKKTIYLGHGNYTWGWFYGDNPVVADLGGNTGDDVAFVRAYDEDGNLIKDSLAFVAEEKTGLEQLVDAKEYTLVFTLADSVKNYQADAYEVVVSVARKPVQATLTAPDSVVYTGKEINAILTVTTTLVGEDKVTVAYNDDADCINYTGEEIVATAQLPNDNYEWADGAVTTVSFTIQKATIDNVTVTISEAPGGVWTTAMMPELTVVSVEPHVGGEVVWDNDSLIAGENKEQPWTFVPDSPNYELYHGSVTLTVVQATLAGVSVEVVKTTEYVAFDAFDRSSIVVEALYGEGPKEITGYTLTFSGGSTEGRLLAGTGITVTVTYTDGDVTQYTEFTINVAKRTVAKPVVDPTIFDATGGTITLPIAESEYYNIYGNTAIEPGRYVATVELKDPVNTMWEDGSTDVVSIAWTIREPVTSDEVIADILAMEKVTWQNAEEFLDLEARYDALDKSEQTADATAKLEVLRAQYDALRNAAFDDIKAAHEVTAKSLGKALAAAAAGLSAAAIALAIAKRRSI